MHLRGGTCDSTHVLSKAAVKRMRVDRIPTWRELRFGFRPHQRRDRSPMSLACLVHRRIDIVARVGWLRPRWALCATLGVRHDSKCTDVAVRTVADPVASELRRTAAFRCATLGRLASAKRAAL